MTYAERKRRQRLRENGGEAFYGFNFPAADLEALLISTGHLHPWAVDSKGNVTAGLVALLHQLHDGVTSVTSGQAL